MSAPTVKPSWGRRVRRKWRPLVREAGPWFLAFVVNFVLAGWLYSLLEHVGPVSGPWWGVVTASTTGYGDLYPHTTASRALAVYLILSSMLLNDVRSARVVKVMVDDPDLYSHDEQERDEAGAALQLSLLTQLARARGIKPEMSPEWRRYQEALAAVAEEEETR